MRTNRKLLIFGIILAFSPFFSCGEESGECDEFCLAVTELFTFTDSEYRFHVTGKVKNFSSLNAVQVTILAHFYSDPDQTIPLLTASQSLPPIPPGEGWRTFDIWSEEAKLLPGAGGLPAIFFSTAVSGSGGGIELIPTPELEFDQPPQIRTDQLSRYHVRGKIVNKNDIPAEMAYFTVSFYRDSEKTDLIARFRKGFGRFLGIKPEAGEEVSSKLSSGVYPAYVLDIWHPEITADRYPEIYYTAEVTE